MGTELLRCKTPEMVEKEIAVHVLAYNIIRGNLAQAAILHNKIPCQLSFRSAVQVGYSSYEATYGINRSFIKQCDASVI